jgi:hypothetical protein
VAHLPSGLSLTPIQETKKKKNPATSGKEFGPNIGKMGTEYFNGIVKIKKKSENMYSFVTV